MSNRNPSKTNPASGLPMLPCGSSGTDIVGNPHGLNFDREEPWTDSSEVPAFDDDLFGGTFDDW
jgi:hypothetical protein